MNTCTNCGKELIGRQDKKFCSERCRKAFVRATVLDNPPKPDKLVDSPDTKPDTTPEEVPGNTGKHPEGLTRTDQTFYDRAVANPDLGPDYYYFTANRHKRVCGFCGEVFITSLRMNKYCSYEHYVNSLRAIAR